MSIHEWIQTGSVSEEIAKQRGLKELIRCKDCKHYHPGFNCDLLQKPALSSDNWFCADGEREEGR